MHSWKVNEWTTCSYAYKFKESINEKSYGKLLFFSISLSNVKDVFFLNRRLLFQWKQIRTKIQRIWNLLAFESSLYLSLHAYTFECIGSMFVESTTHSELFFIFLFVWTIWGRIQVSNIQNYAAHLLMSSKKNYTSFGISLALSC